MKTVEIAALSLLILCVSWDASAGIAQLSTNQSRWWLFRLSLKDYEIKGEGVMEEEKAAELEGNAEDDILMNQDFQTLFNGDQAILLMNAEAVPIAQETEEQIEVIEPPKNFFTVSELIQQQFDFGTYETEGYVVSISECDCPPKSRCEPCAPRNVIVSEQNKEPRGYQFSNEDIIIFIPESSRFELKAKYRFIIQILDAKSTSQKLNNLKLIYYEKIQPDL